MSRLDFSELNWLAIAAAAVGTFLLGGVWYAALFGKKWAALHGLSPETITRVQKSGPANFTLMFGCYVLVAIALSVLTRGLGAESFAEGAVVGLVAWAGIALPIALTDHLPTGRPLGIKLIDSSYQLLYLIGAAGLLAAWR